MIVMVGECTGKSADRVRSLGWGRMWIARDRNIYTYPGEPWGLDNGAFRDWFAGRPFDGDAFRYVLDKAEAHPPPYLAVVPDQPGDGAATLAMFDRWRGGLPDYPWYIALQDGMTPKDVETLPVAGYFLGGTLAFKSRAEEWRDAAMNRGVRFHYGRCGTLGRLAHAQSVGADSIDSAFPMWSLERWALFAHAVANGAPQRDLFFRQTRG